MKTFDCEPTLTDREVIRFCREGYYELPAAVDEEVCRRIVDHLHSSPDRNHEPGALMGEDWFVDGLVCNPQTAGAVRSLLGADFILPPYMANHPGPCPEPVGWHVDGGNMHTFALNYLQVFCIPQDTTVEMGPTELVPGSHFLLGQSALVTHYGVIRGAKKCVGPAGTVFITCYPIWHRRLKATANGGMRHLLKYNYLRNTPPTRDWIVEDDLDPARNVSEFSHLRAGGPLLRRNILDCYDAARMFLWLCGLEEEYRYIGGHAWPMPSTEEIESKEDAYAAPPSLASKKAAFLPTAPPMHSRG